MIQPSNWQRLTGRGVEYAGATRMDDIAIFAAGVVKRYRRTVAVQQFDLSLRRGEVCGLVGPNGAGKSSVIRMLLGLIKPTRGRLFVDCLNPSAHSFTVRQRVGYVPEQHHIYPWMRGPAVLKFAASVYPTWDRSECGRLIKRLGIPMKRRVQELSRRFIGMPSRLMSRPH